MFDLKCKRKGCIHNKNCNCTAAKIYVSKNTDCKTYQPSFENKENEPSKVTQPPIRQNISVKCKANCLFNQNSICSANGISVQTLNDKTEPNCCTFLPK